MTMGPNESDTPGIPSGDLTDKVSVSYLILSRLDDLKRDQERLWQEISGLRQEMGGLHQEVGNLRQDMGNLRQAVSQDISGLRQEVSQDISGLRQEMAQHAGSLRQEIAALRYWSWGSIIAVLIGVITIIATGRP